MSLGDGVYECESKTVAGRMFSLYESFKTNIVDFGFARVTTPHRPPVNHHIPAVDKLVFKGLTGLEINRQ